jgi:hypothetical protein
MSYYDFGADKGDVRCPDMDTNEALRRILAILNDSSAPAPTSGSGSTGGSTTSVGSTFNSITNQTIDVTGTRKQLPSVPTPRGVLLVAKVGNNDPICVGGVGVTISTGTQCGITLTAAGMPSVVIPVSNLSQIYINGTAGDGVGIAIL